MAVKYILYIHVYGHTLR